MYITQNRLGSISWLCYISLAVTALWTRFFLNSDGAYFEFAMLSQDPWTLLWHDFSVRIAALGLPGGLSHLIGLITQSATATGLTYEFIWYSMPIISSILCYSSMQHLDCEKKNQLKIMWHCGLWGLAMPTFGFPTETWFLYFFVWPLMIFSVYPSERARTKIMIYCCIVLVIFSHPAYLFYGLICLLLFLHSSKGQLLKRWQQHFSTATIIAFMAIALWLFIDKNQIYFNPLTSQAVSQNSQHIFSLDYFTRPIPLCLILVSLLYLHAKHLLALEKATPTIKTRAILSFYLLLAVACILAMAHYDSIKNHYLARTGLVILAPILFLLITNHRLMAKIATLAVPIIFISAAGNIAIIAKWASYKNTLEQLGTEYKGTIISEQQLTNHLHDTLYSKRDIYWQWSVSYTLAMLEIPLFISNKSWYTPLTCNAARQNIIAPNYQHMIKEHRQALQLEVCNKQNDID